MRITFIGSGRVAHHLATALSTQHDIVQIYSRNLAHAQFLANQTDAQAINDMAQLQDDVDLIIIAVSDGAIATMIQQASPYVPQVLCVHTSGSTALNVLTAHHSRCGVFYPLQTFSFESQIDWSDTPLLIEAAHAPDQTLLLAVADNLSQRVYAYDTEQRLSLHLAAVFACNFSNYCYDLAKQVVDARGVDFALLAPLMTETALKATRHDPKTVQTGPARRHDVGVLNMHQHLLQHLALPDAQAAYQLLSAQIQTRHPQ